MESVPFKNVSVDLLYQVINAKLISSAAQVKITSYIERKLGSCFVLYSMLHNTQRIVAWIEPFRISLPRWLIHEFICKDGFFIKGLTCIMEIDYSLD